MTRSPTIPFLFGLLLTLGAVTGLSLYSLYRLHQVRKVELNIIDLSRHDSLQLLRVQNDLNAIGLKLRDLSDDMDESRLAYYKRELGRLHRDLHGAMQYESRLSPVANYPSHRPELTDALSRFWKSSDAVFEAVAQGRQGGARELIFSNLSKQEAALATQVSRLLERNSSTEEKADTRIAEIYVGAEKDIYLFLAWTIFAIAATSLYLIHWNRKYFVQLESLSRQRRVLAARLIAVQEEVLRSVSRELHDEFGQILTAVGAMLARAEKKGLPPGSPLRTELSEVREITHGTLEKIRSLSQMLHPAVIDDYGLAKAVEWYAEVFQRQTGIKTTSTIEGHPIRITGQPAIHCFRIVQEALNNAAKHSGSTRAEVTMVFAPNELTVSVRDFGIGMPPAKKTEDPGLGLIAMRERAELLNGKLQITTIPETGTTISVSLPLRQEDLTSDDTDEAVTKNTKEVFSRQNE